MRPRDRPSSPRSVDRRRVGAGGGAGGGGAARRPGRPGDRRFAARARQAADARLGRCRALGARGVRRDARRCSGTTYELVVSLDADRVTSTRVVDGVQPAITPGEFVECERVVRADPEFREALRRRGVTEFDLVTVEAWGIGTHAHEGSATDAWPGRRAGCAMTPTTTLTPTRSTDCSRSSTWTRCG